MLPEHVASRRPHVPSGSLHCFIIDVQPNFPCVAVSGRVKNIDRIVPVACRFAVMVELVMRLL